jgi:hypothetical protein
MDLLEILKKETNTLKEQYIEMCLSWGEKNYNTFKENINIMERNGIFYKNNFGKTKAEDSNLNRIVSILNKGLEVYLDSIKKDAIEHYETSILKLNERILNKGLNIENIKIETSHIDVNIETVLNDGFKKVRAYTIIASGSVQKPHYRYLVK